MQNYTGLFSSVLNMNFVIILNYKGGNIIP